MSMGCLNFSEVQQSSDVTIATTPGQKTFNFPNLLIHQTDNLKILVNYAYNPLVQKNDKKKKNVLTKEQ